MVYPRRTRAKGERVLTHGIKFRSQFERRIYEEALKHSRQLDYEPYKLAYTSYHQYLPDFVLPSGVLVECKGRFRNSDQSKLLAVVAANPSIDLRLVFQNPALPVRRGAKMTHGEWATKHGFIWADGSIPKEWYE